MDLPVDHKAFRGRRLVVRTAGFWKGPRVLLDGHEVPGKRLNYVVVDDTGSERTIVLKPTFLDPIPKVHVDKEAPILLARSLQWYEYLWMAIPILLVFGGGALGAMFGLAAVWTSVRIFRSDRGALSKYALSAVVSTFAVILFVVGASVIQIALGGRQ